MLHYVDRRYPITVVSACVANCAQCSWNSYCLGSVCFTKEKEGTDGVEGDTSSLANTKIMD